MKLTVELGKNSYNIIIERGALLRAGKIFDLDRKTLVLTDDGVPKEYAEAVARQAKDAHILTVPTGEGSKSIEVFEKVQKTLLSLGFTRTDCVVAVGGGVCGDLAGFCAASYMRGIDFYGVPTTLLSQVDSSIGGKTAINLGGIKNIVGAFYQPKAVVIDPDTLVTLDKRQISAGLAEAVKMAATSDRELFELIENGADIDTVIYRSLMIKKAVVEADEKEKGQRRILNFGHTVGHGIESVTGLYHGECVALGMIPVCAEKERLKKVLKTLGLPTKIEVDADKVIAAIGHDKKLDGDEISVVYVEKIGSCEIRKMPIERFKNEIKGFLK
ncbi:MAG: 3-dehydroquinate synthase [Ruminococcaceae bacterium]|nr:3-dehydroquinate synthase [Oscillospiraceae bacterium]